MLKAGRWRDPLFLIGADEFCDFLTWKDPEGVLARARLGVATRPGFPRDRLENVLRELSRPDRVELFEIEPLPISSRDIRDRVARGEPIDRARAACGGGADRVARALPRRLEARLHLARRRERI